MARSAPELGAGDFLVRVDGEEKELGEGVVDDGFQVGVVKLDIGDVRQPYADFTGLELDRGSGDREL